MSGAVAIAPPAVCLSVIIPVFNERNTLEEILRRVRETPIDKFPGDPHAMAVARSLPAGRGRVLAGVLGSANQVNREFDRIAWIRTTWGTSTEDGESAHVAGCASLFGVPTIGLRVVDGTPGEAAGFVLRFVEAWK